MRKGGSSRGWSAAGPADSASSTVSFREISIARARYFGSPVASLRAIIASHLHDGPNPHLWGAS